MKSHKKNSFLFSLVKLIALGFSFPLFCLALADLSSAQTCTSIDRTQKEKIATFIKQRIFFHGTNGRNISSILQTGLQPRKHTPVGTYGATHQDVDKSDCQKNVFLSKDPLTGIKYAGISVNQVLTHLESMESEADKISQSAKEKKDKRDKSKTSDQRTVSEKERASKKLYERELLSSPENTSPILIGIISTVEQSEVKMLSKKPKKLFTPFYQYKKATEGLKSRTGINPQQLFTLPKEIALLENIEDLSSIDNLVELSNLSDTAYLGLIQELHLPTSFSKREFVTCFFQELLQSHVTEGAEGQEGQDKQENKVSVIRKATTAQTQTFTFWKKKVLQFETESAQKLIAALGRSIQETEKQLLLDTSDDTTLLEKKYNLFHEHLVKLAKLNELQDENQKKNHKQNSKHNKKQKIDAFLSKTLNDFNEKCVLQYWKKMIDPDSFSKLTVRMSKLPVVKMVHSKAIQTLTHEQLAYLDVPISHFCFDED